MKQVMFFIPTFLTMWFPAARAGEPVLINEIRIDQPGADLEEYFELQGPADGSLDGLTYLVIGDGAAGSGVIENVTDLSGQVLQTSGLFVAAEDTFTLGTANLTTSLDFENSDNVTHLLVTGFNGLDGDDLDVDDDGILDVTPWFGIVDCVALIETPGSGDQVYCDTQVGPDGTFVPGHAYRCNNGGTWLIGAFDAGTDDTPGMDNPDACDCGVQGTGNCFQDNGTPFCDNADCCADICASQPDCCDVEWTQACADAALAGCTVPGPAPDVQLNEIRINHPGADTDEYFEIAGDPFTLLDGMSYIVIGAGAGGSGTIENVTPLGGLNINGNGFLVGAEATFTLGIADLTTDLNFEHNDSVTHLLVFNFIGSDGQDLDVDDDGTLDVTPWDEIVDSVAIVGLDGNPVYSPATVGPDGEFVPGHVYLCTPDEIWRVGAFDPSDPGATDTPGAENTECSFVVPCGSDLAGDCFEPNGTGNCSDEVCCSTVTQIDATCAENWDQDCVNLALVECLDCGSAETGDCFEPNGTPYCSIEACCLTVCAEEGFEYCCNDGVTGWDQGCADQATLLCEIPEPGVLLITEVVDGTLPGGQPKWVELTNCGSEAVELSEHSIGNYNNGGTELGGGAANALAGVLGAGETYVVAYETAPTPPATSVFEDVYGIVPDLFLGPFINGNDVVALFFGQAVGDGSNATIVDIYGVIGVDGAGQVWEYTDSYAQRLSNVAPTDTFEPAEWSIAGPNALETGDDAEELILLQENTFPGQHVCSGDCPWDCADPPDQQVSIVDLLAVLSQWGGAGSCDFDGGGVAITDLLMILANWGPCP